MNDLAEKMALDLAATVGRLCAIVEWCVDHDGECLGDNPKQLAYAQDALAAARNHIPPATRQPARA